MSESIKYEIMTGIKDILFSSAKAAGIFDISIDDIGVEIPNDKANGDFSSNFALVMAKRAGMNPRKLASVMVEQMSFDKTYIDEAKIAGPGFINFYLSPAYLYDGLMNILELGQEYGKLKTGMGIKVMVEFVSANPTGPLHMGNARGGALGDLIASVFEQIGCDVTKEYYVNDAGNQIYNFSKSLEARYLQHFLGKDAAMIPEDGYQGEDITANVNKYIDLYSDKLLLADEETRLLELTAFALKNNIAGIRSALALYGISFDNWFSEQSLYDNGEFDSTISQLEKDGLTYDADGAKWFKTTEYGCDKDDVIIKSSGIPTYFASDIAYHRNKFFIRKYDKVINLLGADHHGHVARMYAACEALGVKKDSLKIVVFQLVNLMRNGQTARMSKRTGKAISLEDLIDEVGRDAVRFFFNMKASGSHLDFDIDLASKQSNENPVYYVQYAHARICSLFKKADDEGFDLIGEADLTVLKSDEERLLIDRLLDYPEEIRICANTLEPSRLTRYAIDVASLFHSFYNAQRIIGSDKDVFAARMMLIRAVKTVIGNVLSLMKINAPERM